jgi:hypothetical protein
MFVSRRPTFAQSLSWNLPSNRPHANLPMKHLVPSSIPFWSAIGSQEHDLWDVQFVCNNLMVWNLLSLPLLSKESTFCRHVCDHTSPCIDHCCLSHWDKSSLSVAYSDWIALVSQHWNGISKSSPFWWGDEWCLLLRWLELPPRAKQCSWILEEVHKQLGQRHHYYTEDHGQHPSFFYVTAMPGWERGDSLFWGSVWTLVMSPTRCWGVRFQISGGTGLPRSALSSHWGRRSLMWPCRSGLNTLIVWVVQYKAVVFQIQMFFKIKNSVWVACSGLSYILTSFLSFKILWLWASAATYIGILDSFWTMLTQKLTAN